MAAVTAANSLRCSAGAARPHAPAPISDLCHYLGLLQVQLPPRRSFHSSRCQWAAEKADGKEKEKEKEAAKLSAQQKAELIAKRAQDRLKKQEEEARANVRMGSLSSSSAFGDELLTEDADSGAGAAGAGGEAAAATPQTLAMRNYEHMSRALNPRANARARWQRNMLIRHLRRGGRLTKEMEIARTERSHLVKSHFFKTSMKKLAPLCRQIAGKAMDEAILQMRFSKKAVAQDVLQHLIQARNEAIAIKGMGIGSSQALPRSEPVVLDPSISPATAAQKASKKLKDGEAKAETDIYIAQAWINRGPYEKQPDYRARGRVYIMRPPHTGMTVLLKEEKTRMREQREKEEKAIRKRLGKNMWTQLPDRPITNQNQSVLW